MHDVSSTSMCMTSEDLLIVTHCSLFAHNSTRGPRSTRCSLLKCHSLSFTVMPAPCFIVPVTLICLKPSSKCNSGNPEPQASSMITLSHELSAALFSWHRAELRSHCVSLHAHSMWKCNCAFRCNQGTCTQAYTHTPWRCTDAEYGCSKNKG